MAIHMEINMILPVLNRDEISTIVTISDILYVYLFSNNTMLMERKTQPRKSQKDRELFLKIAHCRRYGSTAIWAGALE